MDDRFKHRTVDANGIRIHLVEAGEGPLVVMVHGFPESWYSWRHQLGALAQDGYRAVAVDLRGYGRSSKPSRMRPSTPSPPRRRCRPRSPRSTSRRCPTNTS